MLFIEIGQVFVEIWEGKETPKLVFGPGIYSGGIEVTFFVG